MTARCLAPSNCAVQLQHEALGRTRRVRVAVQASELFCQNVLQDVLVQTQVRNQLFRLSTFVLNLLKRLSSLTPRPPYCFFQR